jgi:hypothetical protein
MEVIYIAQSSVCSALTKTSRILARLSHRSPSLGEKRWAMKTKVVITWYGRGIWSTARMRCWLPEIVLHL